MKATEHDLLQRNNPLAVAWAGELTTQTRESYMAGPEFEKLRDQATGILEASDKIPYVSKRGEYVYNFWQDENHVRGLLRRTTLDDYCSDNPTWKTVLDLDELSKQRDQKLVYKGVSWCRPDYRRCMLRLSIGGGDAVVNEEFDMTTCTFVEGGFKLPEGKSSTTWLDENTLLVTPGHDKSLTTDSSYPQQVKLWRRGQALDDAELIAECSKKDVLIAPGVLCRPEGTTVIIEKALDFYNSETFLCDPTNPKQHTRLDIPTHVDINEASVDWFIIANRKQWDVDGQVFKPGSLISFHRETGKKEVLFEPGERQSLAQITALRSKLMLVVSDNLNQQLFEVTRTEGGWLCQQQDYPATGLLSVLATSDFTDDYMVDHQNSITPSTLYHIAEDGTRKQIKQAPARFDASDLCVEQLEATSSDGTHIPYTVMRPKDIPFDGSTPTILYGYGGFQVSLEPNYSPIAGKNWVEQGGCYVVANIRGGGEFGPEWHQAALKEKRQVAYDDFIAVAEDLIHRKITLPQHLGIKGGSNGGLLVGAVMVQRPDLFAAVDCAVPLLRMKEYCDTSIFDDGSGASWAAEYGNPQDEAEENLDAIRTAIAQYSPYDNLKAGERYPTVLLRTSQHDDRVHPGHARTMALKMIELGNQVVFFESAEEGGHGCATNRQYAEEGALSYNFLARMLGLSLRPALDQEDQVDFNFQLSPDDDEGESEHKPIKKVRFKL